MSPALTSTSRLLLLVAVSILPPIASSAATWRQTSVENVEDAGLSSARFDSAGRPGIAFGTRALTYAAWTATGWDLQVVERGCGGDRGPSLVFDRNDQPLISYHDDNAALRLARFTGAAWAFETVDDSVAVGGATSLALDPAGNPAIAYLDQTNHDLRYASFEASTGWTITKVDGDSARVGEYPSLAFDRLGNPAISYYDRDNGDLKIARLDARTGWQVDIVDGALDAGRWSSLAFDGFGNPAISYEEGPPGSAADLKYARWDGTRWNLEYTMLSSSNGGLSSGFDGSGNPTIAYYTRSGPSGARVRYATRDAFGWTSRIADPQFDSGRLPSLAFDPAGNPGISYLDREHGTLKFTRASGAAFVPEHVAGYGPSGAVSIDFDAAGNPAVSYWGGTLAGLRFARFDGAAWAIEPVDPGLWVGTASSLVFDGAGSPLIAYDDRIGGRLRLARRNGATWTLETVAGPFADPTAPVAPSLALDPAGNPAIAYRENAFSLRLARWDGSLWTIDPVAGSDLTFDASRSLGFDSLGNPAIAFVGSSPTAGTVRFARRTGGTWSVEDIEAGGNPSLAFDGAGVPLVAYTAGGPSVKVARRVGATWQPELVAAGTAGTIAVDPAGNPAVAFRDAATGEVRLARWDGARWAIETATAAGDFAGPLAIDRNGTLALVYASAPYCRAPEVAIGTGAVTGAAAHRGRVASLAPGWQAQSLPLGSLNDDETPPFPSPVTLPGSLSDTAVPSLPLVLYRILGPANQNTGNSLRLVKSGGGAGVTLSF